jgi:hypothetical protein
VAGGRREAQSAQAVRPIHLPWMCRGGAGREAELMASEIKETDNGDGTKRVQQWDDDGTLIYDMTVDSDTVFGRTR